MKIIKYILCLCLFTNILYAGNNLYILPKDSKELETRIIKEINITRESIVISMYNFSYKKIAKALIRAKKRRNVEISVFLDYKKVSKDKTVFKLFKKAGIIPKLITRKLHTKMLIFDDEVLLFGSMNFTKESFKKNYEIVMITDDNSHVKKAKDFFIDSMKLKNK